MKHRAMAFGPNVRMWWTTGEPGAGMSYGSLVMPPEDAVKWAREILEAAVDAAAWRPGRLVALSMRDGRTTRTYTEDV